MANLPDIRKEYMLVPLIESQVETDAMKQFDKWWGEANSSLIEEVNTFTLATATLEGKPSARIILLQSYDENGFVFFTNYTSNKGNELANNPQVSLVFFWKELGRQIRIEGVAEKVSSEESDNYFSSTPESNRIGVWASPQSIVIEKRDVMEEGVLKYQQKFTGIEIPRPKSWGGYRVKPAIIEFWQSRPDQLHDRLQYTLLEDGAWKIERLAP